MFSSLSFANKTHYLHSQHIDYIAPNKICNNITKPTANTATSTHSNTTHPQNFHKLILKSSNRNCHPSLTSVPMDASQDARSKLHTFSRHRWKAGADGDDYDDDRLPIRAECSHNHTFSHHHCHSHLHASHQPSSAIETTKCCQYENHRFVSLKSQCDVRPSDSRCCRKNNRFVPFTRSTCFTTIPTTKTNTTNHHCEHIVAPDDQPKYWQPSLVANHLRCSCICCSCRRRRFDDAGTEPCRGCWKWSFHTGITTMVSIVVAAQFLLLMAAMRRAVAGRRHWMPTETATTMTTTSHSPRHNEWQRMVRSVLLLLLLFNMLPLLFAGKLRNVHGMAI